MKVEDGRGMHEEKRGRSEVRTQKQSLSIRSWPESERPRERLSQVGVEALSTIELLAIILGTGCRQKPVLHLAQEILPVISQSRGNLHLALLRGYPGLGKSKAARIVASVELGKRSCLPPQPMSSRINTAKQVVEIVRPLCFGKTQERFYLLLLDVKNRLIVTLSPFRGTEEGLTLSPRDLFHEAIRSGASAIICAHNHPSGDPTPSHEDHLLTSRLLQGAQLLGLRFLDHVIVADGSYFSFAEENLMENEPKPSPVRPR